MDIESSQQAWHHDALVRCLRIARCWSERLMGPMGMVGQNNSTRPARVLSGLSFDADAEMPCLGRARDASRASRSKKLSASRAGKVPGLPLLSLCLFKFV
ncbi:hypothetical protein HaLaN_00380 [Haematococcus lacustris]|uniref:Uncharacterized protein n=1 Tax=Haematococcus lacustris TaxID=44745 RepID=A0A699YIW1_HAELA|nr:hypothetical protein HaLaN_00380 [Haematococcus lacustris]